MKLKQRLGILIFSLIISSLFPRTVLAAKKFIRGGSTGSLAAGGGNYSTVALFPSRLGMVVNFLNLNKVSKVSYVLSYFGSGQSQGIVGSFTPAADSDSRELLFGTCSHGACRYHENVTTARLVLNFTLKSGGIFTKRYKILVHKN